MTRPRKRAVNLSVDQTVRIGCRIFRLKGLRGSASLKIETLESARGVPTLPGGDAYHWLKLAKLCILIAYKITPIGSRSFPFVDKCHALMTGRGEKKSQKDVIQKWVPK